MRSPATGYQRHVEVRELIALWQSLISKPPEHISFKRLHGSFGYENTREAIKRTARKVCWCPDMDAKHIAKYCSAVGRNLRDEAPCTATKNT